MKFAISEIDLHEEMAKHYIFVRIGSGWKERIALRGGFMSWTVCLCSFNVVLICCLIELNIFAFIDGIIMML